MKAIHNIVAKGLSFFSSSEAMKLETDSEALNLINQGNVVENSGHTDKAMQFYESAARIAPSLPRAHLNIGNILLLNGNSEQAIQSYKTAICNKPDYYPAHYGLGNALLRKGAFADALIAYESAIKFNPAFVDAYVAKGTAMEDLGQHRPALAIYKHALQIDPDHPDANYAYGVCLLINGYFEQGWHHHEWRWKSSVQGIIVPDFPKPFWTGKEDLNGKTILLHAEQGFGDTIQFCRFTQLVSAMGARVILGVPQALRSLLSKLPGIDQFVTHGQNLPDFDFHCPLLSLPLALNTQLSSIPCFSTYISADPRKSKQWAAILSPMTRPRIGLAWSGNASHLNDHNRSMPFSLLKEITSINIQFVSLQTEVRTIDAPLVRETSNLVEFNSELKDFSDTAALLTCMDLVITVDTSVAHLAAAMGKPVWLLLPFNPDWRWLLDRSDSPWYPTVRIFRQPQAGNWKDVISVVRDDLMKWVDLHFPSNS